MDTGDGRACLSRQKMRKKDHGKNAETKTADPLNKSGTDTDKKNKEYMHSVHEITSYWEYNIGLQRIQGDEAFRIRITCGKTHH